MILVHPELIGHEEKIRWQMITVSHFPGVYGSHDRARRNGKMHGRRATDRRRVEALAGTTSVFAAQHDGAVRDDLSTKPKLALPITGMRKQVWKMPVLEVWNPGY